MIDALLATEDERFYEHEGYDFWGMARAGMVNLRSRRIRQGASTITQQLARNACALTQRSYDRKLTEIFLAWRIERAFSKSEILVGYLNRIYLGSGYWGIGAAAEGYFAKEVSELDIGECAMLCGIIRSPHPSSPYRNYERAVAARDDTLQRMLRSGLLGKADAELWTTKETRVRPFKRLDLASRYVLAQIGREANRLMIADSFEGLEIETSLDIRLQHQVETAVEDTLREIEAAETYIHPTRAQFSAGEIEVEKGVPYLQAAVIVLQNTTGEVVAAVGTRSHRESEYDRVWRSSRPAGSSFLPFLYASAFENPNLGPQSLVFDAPLDNREVMIGGRSGILGEWCSESSTSHFEGMMPAAWAFLRGKSSASVRLGFETGLLPTHDLAMRAGIVSPMREYPSSFLGSSEVNLAELTHAYTIFPNLGWRPSRSGLVRKISDENGGTLFEEQRNAKSVRVISEATAAQMNALMARSLPVRSDKEALPIRGEIAGKTGVSYEGTDHWFIGFNSQFTWGVWVGFD
ncbi:MAG: transglycosylase domain-containing protein, partial [Verrucomicrobiota bacterium]